MDSHTTSRKSFPSPFLLQVRQAGAARRLAALAASPRSPREAGGPAGSAGPAGRCHRARSHRAASPPPPSGVHRGAVAPRAFLRPAINYYERAATSFPAGAQYLGTPRYTSVHCHRVALRHPAPPRVAARRDQPSSSRCIHTKQECGTVTQLGFLNLISIRRGV